MPQLPTLTISDQATWDRVYASFHGDPAEYRAWLKEQLMVRVRVFEGQKAMEKADSDLGTGIGNAT
jgi:hypothetical protein